MAIKPFTHQPTQIIDQLIEKATDSRNGHALVDEPQSEAGRYVSVAQQARARAEQLAAKLRALGIEEL